MKSTSTKYTSCPPFKSCEKAELKHTKQYLFGETTEYPMRASAEREKYSNAPIPVYAPAEFVKLLSEKREEI